MRAATSARGRSNAGNGRCSGWKRIWTSRHADGRSPPSSATSPAMAASSSRDCASMRACRSSWAREALSIAAASSTRPRHTISCSEWRMRCAEKPIGGSSSMARDSARSASSTRPVATSGATVFARRITPDVRSTPRARAPRTPSSAILSASS
ncbi:hypothetical protein DVJ78_13075 [Humibacter sp. BT305]|nr:hypothetical protein DVJ78_13075 [Humibacter sp. BT305]